MLNATWLETFTTLAEEGSFTRTAQRLNMTQPGVSQHVKKLEGQAGAALLRKIGREVVLTEAGRALRDLGLARRAEETALRERIGRDRADEGPVALGCSGSFAQLLYPRLMPRLAAAPALRLRLEAAPQATVIEAVATGRLDLGVVGGDPGQARIEARRIGAEALHLVTPAALAQPRPDFATLEALGFIDHPDGAGYAEALMPGNFDGFQGAEALRRRGFVNQIGQIPAPVAQGIGYTILPASGIAAFPARDALRIAELSSPVRQELWLIQRAGRELPARCRWLAGAATELAEALEAGTAAPA